MKQSETFSREETWIKNKKLFLCYIKELSLVIYMTFLAECMCKFGASAFFGKVILAENCH